MTKKKKKMKTLFNRTLNTLLTTTLDHWLTKSESLKAHFLLKKRLEKNH